jgi:hypothetical protein
LNRKLEDTENLNVSIKSIKDEIAELKAAQQVVIDHRGNFADETSDELARKAQLYTSQYKAKAAQEDQMRAASVQAREAIEEIITDAGMDADDDKMKDVWKAHREGYFGNALKMASKIALSSLKEKAKIVNEEKVKQKEIQEKMKVEVATPNATPSRINSRLDADKAYADGNITFAEYSKLRQKYGG